MSKKRSKSEPFEAIHSVVSGMHKAGTVDKATMKDFDEMCIADIADLSPREIKKLRENCNVSQPVFARYLNTSESTVEKWETGAKRPSGIALKLLNVVRKHGLRVLA
jgi:putative transcriptional regulator